MKRVCGKTWIIDAGIDAAPNPDAFMARIADVESKWR
jgi:hypothetical protein